MPIADVTQIDAAVLGAIATLLILSVFRYVEGKVPSEFYAHHMLAFARDSVMAEDEMRKTLAAHGFSIANLSSRLTDGGKQFEYRMVLRSRDPKSAESLSQYLRKLPQVIEFRISPTGD